MFISTEKLRSTELGILYHTHVPLVNEIPQKKRYEKRSFTASLSHQIAIFSTHQNKTKINL